MKQKKRKTKNKRKATTAPKSGLRQSKSDNFIEEVKKNNPMIEYMTRLHILNPAAKLMSSESKERREGGYVSLAHAREEFKAPEISKGKGAAAEEKKKKRKNRNPQK